MSEKKNPEAEEKRKSLLYSPKNGYDRVTPEELEDCGDFAGTYKLFLDAGKTEREAAAAAAELAARHGFKPFKRGSGLQAGDRIIVNNRNKALILAVIGEEDSAHGVNIAAAHIDAPRIDIKANPLYEDGELAYFKTHYYGGIKKYQWVALPLELRGVIALKDGGIKKITAGGASGEPVFTITDLLPHLSADQMKKTLGDAITGEGLNVLLGSRPYPEDEGKDRVKLLIMDILNREYNITEEDFLSAELSLVPAFGARDVGFDRSMVGAYGQDDRVCAYAALRSILAVKTPKKTAVCVLADKEEIGSEGVTGMKSAFFDAFISDICDIQGTKTGVCLENSFCLSADVTTAFDPNYPEVYEKRNSSRLNYGIGVCKYTGSRGKSGASDASAETIARVRALFDGAGIPWHTTELGKVDQGGGGTVAAYMAERNIETVDVGVPVLSMHSPFEVISKLDLYYLYKGISAFYNSI